MLCPIRLFRLTCGQYTDPSGDPLYMAAGCLHGASATATCGQDTCPGGCGSSVQADCSTAINAMSGGGSPLLPADAKCFGGSGNNDCVNIEGALRLGLDSDRFPPAVHARN